MRCVCETLDESTQQLSGFATAAQFEAAFGQASDFNVEPAMNNEGIYSQLDVFMFLLD